MAAKPTATFNVDRHELQRFEAQADQWWDPEGDFKGLHDINPLRLNYICERIELAGKRVLDVGCGGGILAEAMAIAGAQVTGIDAGETPLKVARFHMHQRGLTIDYRRQTAEGFAARHPAGFDAVTCMELLEHVPDPKLVVAACSRLVKPGGHVFFATLNRTVRSYLLAILAAENILGVVKKGTHHWHKFIKPQELDRWAVTAGLTFQNLSGLYYNPVLKRQGLNKNTTVNYLMHFMKSR
jgi:2-polyprenyl-6-hydroxyphenyl methylase/3-demethylubiquinone-9 3-methyltransferase